MNNEQAENQQHYSIFGSEFNFTSIFKHRKESIICNFFLKQKQDISVFTCMFLFRSIVLENTNLDEKLNT